MTDLPLSTSAPRTRDVVRHELVRRDLVVTAVHDLTAAMRRVTLTGASLAGFASPGPEDHVKLFLPSPDGRPLGGAPDAPRVIGRDYTPSAFRPEGASGGPELDIDFVIHGDGGPASAWAAAAEPGSTLSIGGPRGSRLAPTGFDRAVLVADPTGAPALVRWLRALADVPRVAVVIFGDDPDLLSVLPERAASAEVVPAGAEADLPDAVDRAGVDADTFVWAAGEANALIPLRRHLRRSLGLPKEHVGVHGYWKRGLAGLDHHAPLDPDDTDD